MTLNPKFIGKVLLIVEDDEVCAHLIKEILEDTGLDILHAPTAGKGIEIIKSGQQVDMIFMDIQLPDMSGLQASVAIKNIAPSIPIVIQTAYSFESYLKKSKEIGCDDFIVKPLEPQKIIDAVNKYIKH